MLCDACQQLCVRPHTLKPCEHVVCEPCCTEQIACPVLGCETRIAARVFDHALSRLLERNYGAKYRVLDARKSRTLTEECVAVDEALQRLQKRKTGMEAEGSQKKRKAEDEPQEPSSKKPTPRAALKFFFDLETTDLDRTKCRIAQIGCVAETPEGNLATFNELVKADRSFHPEAAKKTGLSDDMLRNARPCKEVLQSFLAWMDRTREGHAVVLVAHNGIDFDYPVLMAELWRWDMHPYTTLRKHGVVRLADSLVWARVNIPPHMLLKNENGDPSRALGLLHEALVGYKFDNAHDALADCHALKRICESDYLCRKGFNVDRSDSHSCKDLKECVDDFQPKRESIDRVTQSNIKQQVNQCTKRTLLSFFKPKEPTQ